MAFELPIGITQLNPIVGDIKGNLEKITTAYRTLSSQGAKLIICPELCVTGYPPEDLILTPAFRATAMEAVQELAGLTKDKEAALIIGTVWEIDDEIYNAALLIDGGEVQHVQTKYQLPNYGIFDEKRIFTAGPKPQPFPWRNHTLGLLICEDIWHEESYNSWPTVDLTIVINASPFERKKHVNRYNHALLAVKHTKAPLIYVNLAGGQDDIIFDGGSFSVDADGFVTTAFPTFAEHMAVIHQAINTERAHPVKCELERNEKEELWQACMVGLRDYVEKNGFPGVLLGLSGGIDSAMVTALAVQALGKERVLGVLLPSPFSSPESTEDALESAALLGIETLTIPISPALQSFEAELTPAFEKLNLKLEKWVENVSIGGNIQARIRGNILMGLSNATGKMLVNTSNKSEIAVGYSTLYGDSCGGYSPLKDIYKTEIYELAEWRNRESFVIPKRSISKAPTAELKPGQTDQDHLPDYPTLDKILHYFIEERFSAEDIIAKGFEAEMVKKVITLIRNSEYKRRQFPPGPKLGPMQFTRDWRMPLTNKFK